MTFQEIYYIITSACKLVHRFINTYKLIRRIKMYEQFADLLVEELQIDRDEITMDAELSNDLGINSIELADLVMLCEDRFGIEINDDDIRKFTTVRDVVNYLETLN